MRRFNTSGPNIPEQHYTIVRHNLIAEGRELVHDMRYFTIWAPRQTGKSTYFRQLAGYLEQEGYKVMHINLENYKTSSLEALMAYFQSQAQRQWGLQLPDFETMEDWFNWFNNLRDNRLVLIIDEIEGLNPALFGQFLHSIRNLYHSRQHHSLHSVVLVGVTNILGVVSDNASPFNIADNLEVPYFTEEEVLELLAQHEAETGQRFDDAVKAKIFEITAGQPGLVNGFARKLVEDYPDAPALSMEHYLKVEDWYLTEAIDKNFENILKIARSERPFVEQLLFTSNQIPFKIDRPSIKVLHTNGLIRKDEEGNVVFWVPFYKKRLYDALYPYTNGEKSGMLRSLALSELFDADGRLRLDSLLNGYKAYVKRRGFNAFRERDETGKFVSIKESALIYSFETYIQAFLQAVEGKSYREAHTGLGRSDLVINVRGEEYLIESKVYYYELQFVKGKMQLAYYCRSLGLSTGIYLVFCPNNIRYPETVHEGTEQIEGVEIRTCLVEYDEEKWEK